MIDVEQVTKFFGPIRAVDNISFRVNKGEIVGFLGLNGAGKSTTMRILTTFMPATSGVARVANFDVMKDSMDVRRNIGYLPENVPLYPEMRVDEYLTYRATLKGVDRKERQKQVEHCLDRCRIREVRRRLIGTLSRGYRQRVGLADALVHNPPILILDEPTAGLDPVQKHETLNSIRELRDSHTILFSTHMLSEVEAVCERVIIINKGRLGLDKKMKDLTEAADTAVIIAEIRGPRDRVTNVLETTEGVEEVKARPLSDDLTAYEIKPRRDQDLREAIFDRVVRNDWKLRRLDLRVPRLEELFMNVVNRGEEVPAAN